MNNNNIKNNKNGNQLIPATTEAPATKAAAGKPGSRDPRGFGYYAFDRTLDTVKGGIKHWDEEKPGTSRKLAGVAATGVGGTMLSIGIYLLVS